MTLTGDELATRIREQIRSGDLPPGTKLDSVRALAAKHDVGRGIAQQAVNKLLAEGLVSARHGSGVYVRDAEALIERHVPRDVVASKPFAGQKRVVQRIDEVPAPFAIAENFRLETGVPVVLRRSFTYHDDRPVHFEEAYFPVELARGTPIAYHDPGEGGIYARLAELGAKVTAVVERVRGRAPSPEDAADLGLRAGSAMVLEVVRLSRSGNRVVEVARQVFDASVFEVVYELEVS